MRIRITIATTTQIRRRDGVAFELFVSANPVFFQSAAGISVSSNLPFRRQAEHTSAFRHGCELDAGAGPSGAVSVPLQ